MGVWKNFALIFCLCLAPLAWADDEEPVVLSISKTVATEISEGEAPDSIAAKMEALEQKLELEHDVASLGWFAQKRQQAADKLNFNHRLRVGRREVNAAAGDASKVSKVPVGAVLFNGAALMIGAHVAESTVIGPAMIAAANSGAFPTAVNWALASWGGLLMVPVPTGIVPVDALTETFCWVALVTAKTDIYQKTVYRIEMALVKVGGWLAKAVGADKVWNALMEKRGAYDRLTEAMKKGSAGTVQIPAEDLAFRIQDKNHETLARLELGKTEKGDLNLKRFELHPKAETAEGREQLSQELKAFGGDIRDAVLKPEQLVKGGHGHSAEGEEVPTWDVHGTSVLMKSQWRMKPAVQTQVVKAVGTVATTAAALLISDPVTRPGNHNCQPVHQAVASAGAGAGPGK